MTQVEKEKLEIIFYEKYMDLAFSYNMNDLMQSNHRQTHRKTWKSYLESIKCTVRTGNWASLAENYYTKFDSLIKDPSPFGGYIQISEEDALKILALGLP